MRWAPRGTHLIIFPKKILWFSLDKSIKILYLYEI